MSRLKMGNSEWMKGSASLNRPGGVEAEPVATLSTVENNVNAGYWKGKETLGALLWTASVYQANITLYLYASFIFFFVPFLLFMAAADTILVLNQKAAPVRLLSCSWEF